MRFIKQKTVHCNYITVNKFAQLYTGNPGDLTVFRVFYIGLRINKNEPMYDSKDFSKLLHGKRGWVCFFIYLDEKCDNNNNFFQRNNGN